MESLFNGFRLNSAALDEMGKSRTWKLIQAPDSKIPVAPVKAGDKAGDYELVSLVSGRPGLLRQDHHHGGLRRAHPQQPATGGRPDPRRTRRGRASHGRGSVRTRSRECRGKTLPNDGRRTTDFEVHPNHIADANRGRQSRMPSAAIPTTKANRYASSPATPAPTRDLPSCPSPSPSVANELGMPVTAPTSKVGTSPDLVLNQTPHHRQQWLLAHLPAHGPLTAGPRE